MMKSLSFVLVGLVATVSAALAAPGPLAPVVTAPKAFVEDHPTEDLKVMQVEGLRVTRGIAITCEQCFLGPNEVHYISFKNKSEKLYRVRKVVNYGSNATAEITKAMIEILSDGIFHEECLDWNSYFIYNRRGGLVGWVHCTDE